MRPCALVARARVSAECRATTTTTTTRWLVPLTREKKGKDLDAFPKATTESHLEEILTDTKRRFVDEEVEMNGATINCCLDLVGAISGLPLS